VNQEITLRPITDNDQDFLYHLYANYREDELRVINWEQIPMDKESFLQMQFKAQEKYYIENYIDAEFMIVFLQDKPIGRFYLHRKPEEIRIIDIILLSEYRNQGIGSNFFQDILTEAQTLNLPVRLHVEYYNRAINLYQRLGFRYLRDNGVYKFMEWQPKK
jgi:GNAT superfamily N-acetyltransferase